MKICLMGASTSTNNRGVSALAVSLVKIIWSIHPDAQISFILGSSTSAPQKIVIKSKEFLLPTIGYRLSPKSRLKDHLAVIFLVAILLKFIPGAKTKAILGNRVPVIKKMLEADIVADIQGGDSFSDIYGTFRYLIGIALPGIALLLGRRFVFLPQTYGPYKSGTSRFFSRMLLRRAEIIFSRDKNSMDIINPLLGSKTRPVHYCPDVAFVLDPMAVAKPAISPPLLLPDKRVLVGININGLMYNGGYTRSNMFGLKVDYKTLIIKIIERLLFKQAVVLLVPHTYGSPENVNSDPYACMQVINRFPGRDIHSVNAEYNQSEIKSIIGLCDFFIGSRMHSCIAALSQCIPTVGIAYSAKFTGVFESAGVGNTVIDCRLLEKGPILEKVEKIFEDRASVRQKLLETVELVQKSIVTTLGRKLR